MTPSLHPEILMWHPTLIISQGRRKIFFLGETGLKDGMPTTYDLS